MFEILKSDPTSRARLGILTTPHGTVETPAYVIVGTNAAVRCLTPEDLQSTKTQLIIANTYHLWRSLGDEGLNDYPGLHEVMQWSGPLMTDSGGFQVFSLGALRERRTEDREKRTEERRREDRGKGKEEKRKNNDDELDGGSLVRITDSGVYFRPHDDMTEELYLDAELSIKIQEQLGADIIVAFDEPTSPGSDRAYTKQALERTNAWAERSLEAKQSEQIIYGVVQGGSFEELRRESARHIGGLGFDGIAIGGTYGDAYGGTKEQTRRMIRWSVDELPTSKPRHLFGVGRIDDLFAGVEEGIDTFDCVVPTREARHGRLWTAQGALDILKGSSRDDDGAIDESCECPVCGDEQVSRRELHRLFKEKNPDAGRFATLHNVYFFNNLMEQIRRAIAGGTFAQLKKEYLSIPSDVVEEAL
jgi:queuine tRNA-ribosyltransferase